MKNNYVLLSAALSAVLSAVSCSRENVGEIRSSEMVKYPVTLSVEAPQSKISISELSGESKINCVYLYAFDRASGNVESVKRFDAGQTSLELKLSRGKKTIVAVANYDTAISVTDSTSLESSVVSLSTIRKDNVVMVGKTSVNVNGASSASIELKRRVAKICFSKLTTDFSAPAYKSSTFTVKDVYLSDVSSSFQLAGATSLPSTLNPSALSETLGGIIGDANLGINMSGSTSQKIDRAYFSAPDYGTHRARLIVAATLQGVVYYYPLTLPKLEANKVYTVSDFKITRPGALTPDENVDIDSCTLTITVRDWDTGEEISQTI